jgi:hypothetical protein
MAVMRKMLAVAAHLLKHEEESYDPSTDMQPMHGLCKGG